MKVLRKGLVFYVKLDGVRAQIVCRKRSDDLIVLSSHTPEDYRGQGIATSIMKQVVLYARKNKLNIVPACTFAVHYCKKYKC